MPEYTSTPQVSSINFLIPLIVTSINLFPTVTMFPSRQYKKRIFKAKYQSYHSSLKIFLSVKSIFNWRKTIFLSNFTKNSLFIKKWWTTFRSTRFSSKFPSIKNDSFSSSNIVFSFNIGVQSPRIVIKEELTYLRWLYTFR